MMKKILLLWAGCLLMLVSTAVPKRVLFIGNSYTAVNNLPNMFQELALSLGDTLVVQGVSPGGFTFNGHTTNAATQTAIKAGNWDYVILQEQSQIPAFSPAQVQADCVPFAKTLCDTIRAYNPCAEIVFYMTWGRKNGDASNCANYPPICTYTGMQQGLYNSYLLLCDSNNATCSPVGAVWREVRNQQPGIELYAADESHPSVAGTYLAACTFYSSMFGKPVLSSQYSPGAVSTSEGFYIRQIADAVVLDSIETWHQEGSIPKAAFTKNITGAQVNFTNTSLRANQYIWDFGDGSVFSNLPSPSHTYTSSGTYVVTLQVNSSSCKTDIVSDTITVQVATGIQDVQTTSAGPSIVYNQQQVCVHFPEAGTFSIIDITGKLLSQKVIAAATQENLPALSSGLYVWRWENRKPQQVHYGKLLVP